MTAQEAISYIEAYTWSSTRLGLGRTFELLEKLGNPQKDLKFVHVAGSNGKGSTCAMLDSILRKAGYRVGLYTSPYIEDFCERMQINGKNIPGDVLAEITDRVRVVADEMEDHPSQFELVTAIAMLYFKTYQCDIVVLEVGMGGSLDSTNVIDCPEVAVITNIGLEHTEYLGTTLSEIASAKGGIIKEGCSCVCYNNVDEVLDTIRDICLEKHCDLTITNPNSIVSINENLDGQDFLFNGIPYHVSLLGEHQLSNSNVVLSVISALRNRGWNIPEEAVIDGLKDTVWPARLEVLSKSPLILLDGGHNPQCANALAGSLQKLLGTKKAVFLIGVLADKNYPEMIQAILPYASEFVCLTPESTRALSAVDLEIYLNSLGQTACHCETVQEGLSTSLAKISDEVPLVCFGSLYLVGHIRSAFPSEFQKVIRKQGIRARDSMTSENRLELANNAVKQIRASELYRNAKTILIYKAVRGELPLTALEEAATVDEKILAYPKCGAECSMKALIPALEDGWSKGPYGISEPNETTATELAPDKIDLVICPCSAFDEACNRVGMGAGYYDRYLPFCTSARICAVAFESQKADRIPVSPWDQPMEYVFTDKNTHKSQKRLKEL